MENVTLALRERSLLRNRLPLASALGCEENFATGFPEVCALLRPPATICQPFGLQPLGPTLPFRRWLLSMERLMNLDDIPVAGPIESFLWNALEWLNPLVLAIGLCVTIWAFVRSRRWGYVVVGIYFALALFSIFVMPSIYRAIDSNREPNVSEQTQRKIAAAVQEATERVLEEEGHPVIAGVHTVQFPLGPMVLVAGLWLVARSDSRRAAVTVDDAMTH